MRAEEIVQALAEKVRTEAWVSGLLLLGSHGSNGATPTGLGSDIDFLFITSEPKPYGRIRDLLEGLVPDARRLLSIEAGNKLILYLRDPLLKLDLGFAQSLEDNARYIRGSEGATLLYDASPGQSLEEELSEMLRTKAAEVLYDYKPAYHRCRFLEMFELLAKSIARADVYRVQFYSAILRQSLVVLELHAAGEREHLYLPKMAFPRLAPDGLPSVPLPSGEVEDFWDMGEALAKVYLRLRAGTAEIDDDRRFLEQVQIFYQQSHQ